MSQRKVTQTNKRSRQAAARKQTAQRRTGLYIIGAVVLLALVVVGVLIAQNAPTPVAAEDFNTVEPRDWPQQEGKFLGPADAPVVVRVFSDFQCPFCRQFSAGAEEQLIEQYVASGQVRYEYRHYIVIDRNVGGSESRHAAWASECAAQQGAFWDYHELIFANQGAEGSGALSDARLRAFAENLGLEMDAFNQCFTAPQTAKAVTDDEAMARQLQVSGTPALYIGTKLITNPLDFSSIQAEIEAALAAAQ